MLPVPIVLLILAAVQETGVAPPAPQEEWSWGADRVSSAYLALVREFQKELDAAKESDGETQIAVEHYSSRFLALVERGDPDAKRWMLEFADWERAAADPDLARRLLAYLDDLLREHGEEWRAEMLRDPIAEAWFFLRKERDQLLARVDAYVGKTSNAKGRARVARGLGGALFFTPRSAEDQDHARRLCQLVDVDTEDAETRAWARRISETLEWQRIGGPAREIEGKDVDGKDLRLSDQRGKIVVLDFWGFW